MSSQDVDARLTDEPQQRLLGVTRHVGLHLVWVQPRAAATRATWYAAASGLMCGIETGRRGRDQVDRDRPIPVVGAQSLDVVAHAREEGSAGGAKVGAR